MYAVDNETSVTCAYARDACACNGSRGAGTGNGRRPALAVLLLCGSRFTRRCDEGGEQVACAVEVGAEEKEKEGEAAADERE